MVKKSSSCDQLQYNDLITGCPDDMDNAELFKAGFKSNNDPVSIYQLAFIKKIIRYPKKNKSMIEYN